jgi:predicted branched-subunit amino acid permease
MGSAVGRGSEGYIAGVRAGVPFALVVGVVAFSFGVLARSLGWGVIAPIVFSVVTYSAAAQFAVAMVLGAGGGALTAIAAAVLLNARFLPIGVSVTPFLFPNTSWRSFAASASPDLS